MSDLVTPLDLDALSKLVEAATPTPWRWGGSVHDPMLHTVGRGHVYVMGFERSGMRGAQPTFQVYGENKEPGSGLMTKAADLAVRERPYRDDIVDIDNPDARLIVAAVNALPDLIDRLNAVRELCEDEDRHVGGVWGDYGEIVLAIDDVRAAAGFTTLSRPHGADFAVNNRDLRAAATDAEQRVADLEAALSTICSEGCTIGGRDAEGQSIDCSEEFGDDQDSWCEVCVMRAALAPTPTTSENPQ